MGWLICLLGSNFELTNQMKRLKMILRNYFQSVFISFFLRHVLCHCSADCGMSCVFDCQSYQAIGHNISRVYHVIPAGMVTGYDVYCDMVTDGGGWLIFQRRLDGTVGFNRNWVDFEFGFGDVAHEHWLGLLTLERIISQGHYEIRFDLEDFEGNSRYAHYKLFNICNRRDNYAITIGGYSGNAGDSMSEHDGQMFSTQDRDNDIWQEGHCAETYKGAWWHSNCHTANLNGQYLRGNHTSSADGVNWNYWKGYYYSLKLTEIKIRRV